MIYILGLYLCITKTFCSQFYSLSRQTRKWPPRESAPLDLMPRPLTLETARLQGAVPAMSVVSACRCPSDSSWPCSCVWLTSPHKEVSMLCLHSHIVKICFHIIPKKNLHIIMIINMREKQPWGSFDQQFIVMSVSMSSCILPQLLHNLNYKNMLMAWLTLRRKEVSIVCLQNDITFSHIAKMREGKFWRSFGQQFIAM